MKPSTWLRPNSAPLRPLDSGRTLLQLLTWSLFGLCTLPAVVTAGDRERIRVATFNVTLNDDDARLPQRLQAGDAGAAKAAAIIQRVRPDLLLLNEFDYDAEGRAADLFQRNYLEVGQFGEQAIHFPHRYLAEVNTGVASGLDLNQDGRADGANDAWGFGQHPGQYGMLVLSRFPLQSDAVRSFRLLPWSRMPGALRPLRPDGSQPFHSDAVWQQLRLSSKSHWDIPVSTPWGPLHFLVSHPTPPVFDGPENLNGLRNHDEIRLWAEYLNNSPNDWLVDDAGVAGGLPAGERYVIAGDQNADPNDGVNPPGTIAQLLDHPRAARYEAPRSAGASEAANRNPQHRTDPGTDTAQFGERAGNLRVDYVIPSREFRVLDSGVFWPAKASPEAQWLDASDHHLVWIDIACDGHSSGTTAPP